MANKLYELLCLLLILNYFLFGDEIPFIILKLSIKSCIHDTLGKEGDGDASMHELSRFKQRADSGSSGTKSI